MDGFHVQNVQYLYEDQDLRNETLIPGKTGNVSAHKKHKKMVILTIVKQLMNQRLHMYLIFLYFKYTRQMNNYRFNACKGFTLFKLGI